MRTLKVPGTIRRNQWLLQKDGLILVRAAGILVLCSGVLFLPEHGSLYSELKVPGSFVRLKIILFFKNNLFWNSSDKGKASYSGICCIVKLIGEITD